MGRSRLQLQARLEQILEPDPEKSTDQVHYQRPEGVRMQYPALIYSRIYGVTEFADNSPYVRTKQYQVIAILNDPDDPVADRLENLPMCTFEREYPEADLLHKVFNLYF